jgi:microcompartment protein CcmK/EutM
VAWRVKRATVVGEVWGTRRARGLDGRRLLLLQYDARDGAPRLEVAIDVLDTRVGQQALVAHGSGARNVLRPGPDNRDLLCDAAIALLVDGDG